MAQKKRPLEINFQKTVKYNLLYFIKQAIELIMKSIKLKEDGIFKRLKILC